MCEMFCVYMHSSTTSLQVTVKGTAMIFSGSADLQFIGNVTRLSLMNGVTYTVSVVARNSVGDSETFTHIVFVPCEWVLTMVCGVYDQQEMPQYMRLYHCVVCTYVCRRTLQKLVR